jgi:hypothetical protein
MAVHSLSKEFLANPGNVLTNGKREISLSFSKGCGKFESIWCIAAKNFL